MTTPFGTRLDDFARRLHELEGELAGLRQLAATAAVAEQPGATPLAEPRASEPRVPEARGAVPAAALLPQWVPNRLALARDLFARGELKTALRVLESDRSAAFDDENIDVLAAILEVTREFPSSAPQALRERAGRLGFALEQNIRFLSRKRDPREPLPTTALPRPAAPHEQPAPAPARPPARPPVPRLQIPAPAPAPAHPARPPRQRPVRQIPDLSVSDLFGARALALAGGVVTLLGIVFFFVLAVNRGWIGPVGRVGLGAGASFLVFAAGFELRRRYGDAHSALAAVGVGIAGGFVTVLAAAALYDLLPDYAALAAAAAIAAVGVATSLRWRSQIIAGLGLIGAMLMPVAVIAQGGLSVLGTAFVAIVLAATGVVALRQRWRELLAASVVTSLPQIAVLTAQAQYHAQGPWRIVALAAAFSLIYLATGIAYQLRLEGPGLRQASTSLITLGGLLAAASAFRLYGTLLDRGIALLAITLFFALLAGMLLPRRPDRDLSAFLAAISLTLGAIALADLLSGQPLAYAWAAEGAVLAWLARRLRELRYQVWSLLYLVLALGHVLLLDAPPKHLFTANSHPAAGAAAALALAVATTVFALHARPWDERFVDRGGLYGLLSEFFSAFEDTQRALRSDALWLAGVLATYAASLGTLAGFTSFDWGHVAVAALWSLLGLGVLVAGLLRDSKELRVGGLAWLGTTAAIVVVHGVGSLAPLPLSWALLIVATALVVAALSYQHLHRRPTGIPMDVSALLATAGVVLGAIATAGLLSGQPLAYAWAAEAAALAVLARRTNAPHYQALSIGTLGLVLGHVLALDTPPSHFLSASDHPAHAVLTVVAAAVAATVLSENARGWKPEPTGSQGRYVIAADLVSFIEEEQRTVRDSTRWLAGVLATYAASLGTLAVFASFDWGHVAVAGLWSSVGLAILLAGLLRDSKELRVGALGWLGATLVEVVAHGEIALAQTPRSWSYLIVAAATLASGFAYQIRRRQLTTLAPTSAALVLVSLALSTDAIVVLLRDTSGAVDPEGAAFLGLASVYGALAAAVFRRAGQRDFRTLLWALAVVVGAVSAEELIAGTYLVLAWAAGGATLAWLSARTREARFLVGAAAYIALALAYAVIVQSPPGHLFSAQLHPASGAPAVLMVAAALAAFAHFLVGQGDVGYRERLAAWWLAGVLAVYGASLAILDVAQRAFPHASLHTSFQRGHTAVSAFWGVLGLALLYAGLKRWRVLRLSGLAVLGISIAKIFLYDLPSLSSVTRALSFLAVGAVLLLGGFFYQRLTDDSGTADRGGTPSAPV